MFDEANNKMFGIVNDLGQKKLAKFNMPSESGNNLTTCERKFSLKSDNNAIAEPVKLLKLSGVTYGNSFVIHMRESTTTSKMCLYFNIVNFTDTGDEHTFDRTRCWVPNFGNPTDPVDRYHMTWMLDKNSVVLYEYS